MSQAVIYGFAWGFVLCFTFGPAFFAIIQTSIDARFKKGLIMSLGVVAADAILMFFAIFGTNILPVVPNFDNIMAILSAAILMAMGLYSILYGNKKMVYPESRVGSFLYFFTKGLILNISNPANFFFVVSTCTYLKASLHYGLGQIIAFCLSAMIATFLAQGLIAFYARKLKHSVNNHSIKLVRRVSGVAFILLAIKLLWNQFA
jgi:L-lysine exporter family protein LysE/ArgO